jgi:membrane-bound lytic murein transglycosylase B
VDRIITDEKIAKGRHKYEEHSDLLREIGERYGVQPRFIVALWGIETDFGRVTGAFQVLPALATLAYDSRRSAYFRSELFHALTIIDEGHTTPERMIGSWAGAMGQPQFMPSTFVRFAVDYDGDGRRDIWTTPADVFASAANYLSRSGWRNDHTWGREVRLPEVLEPTLFGLEVVKKLDEWNGLGLRRVNGRPLPKRDLVASLIRPVEGEGPAYLVYDNFRMLMKWNRSIFFALTVGQLADRIGDR